MIIKCHAILNYESFARGDVLVNIHRHMPMDKIACSVFYNNTKRPQSTLHDIMIVKIVISGMG